MGECEIE